MELALIFAKSARLGDKMGSELVVVAEVDC